MDLEQIVNIAAQKNISDVHIQPGKPVYFRENGHLIPATNEALSKDMIAVLIEKFDGRVKEKFEGERQVDFSLEFASGVRVRVNLFNQTKGPSLALRIINSRVKTLEELGLPLHVSEKFNNLKQGLVLVVGATGTGKSTSMATLLNEKMQRQALNVITIEDPIEYIFNSDKSLVSQRLIGEDVWSFKDGIVGAMREDPDVLLVGEMRDYETISAALSLAETGHLVISTMHANDCVEVLGRLIESFPSAQQNQIRVQLASVLKMVISQKLIPTVNKERVLAYEIMNLNYAIANKIREGNLHQIGQVFELSAGRDNMISFERCLLKLVKKGIVTYKEARLHVTDAAKFDSLAGIKDLK